ncbi:transporter [Gramella lutea]|uniref:Transporter n=1 Tax=Christiangramia lutea TaxID=1607951 RepID=A0A9X1V6W3_9FLAO|nr:outer membrane beta-barrel protein [Christiangramia lutea]MCH4823628.1 transporter [Christiangramia lutea]
MQNFIITFLLFLFSLLVSAQETTEKFNIVKGTIGLGGSIGINTNSAESNSYEGKGFGFGISPEAGYFLSDNLSLGVMLGFNYYSSENTRSNELQESTSSTFTIEPYLQKFFSVSKSLALSLTGSVYYSRNWYEYQNTNCLNCSNTDRNNYGIAIRPGLSYLLSEKFSLDADIGA